MVSSGELSLDELRGIVLLLKIDELHQHFLIREKSLVVREMMVFRSYTVLRDGEEDFL